MDILQVILIFLIILLSIFLTITGFQVLLILRNLKKALDKLNEVLDLGMGEKREKRTQQLVETLEKGESQLTAKKESKSKRFYKKTL